MSQGNTDVSVQAPAPTVAEDVIQESCSIIEILSRVSGKWAIGILLVTMQRPARFAELEREINGISRRMLTLTLRNLERDGLVTRTVYPTVPPKVEYAATDMARELYDTLRSLTGWARRHQHAIAAARITYDAAQSTPATPVR